MAYLRGVEFARKRIPQGMVLGLAHDTLMLEPPRPSRVAGTARALAGPGQTTESAGTKSPAFPAVAPSPICSAVTSVTA